MVHNPSPTNLRRRRPNPHVSSFSTPGGIDDAPGVNPCLPERSSLGTLKTKVVLGFTEKSVDQFLEILEELFFDPTWNGTQYNLLQRNCCHFSTLLAKKLGVGDAVPDWVNTLARSLGGLDPEVEAAFKAAEGKVGLDPHRGGGGEGRVRRSRPRSRRRRGR